MTGNELLEKMIGSYRSSFDIERPYRINEDTYDAYARFDVSSVKYVLVKKAQLWKADCYEHCFFAHKELLTQMDLEHFHRNILEVIEPQMVRRGEPCTKKDHMYTYITGIFIAEDGITDEMKRVIRKFKFFKNYKLGFRGYSEARLLVFDMKKRRVLGNKAARELVKGYKKTI